MADLLLELFSEEIPARMQAKAEADLLAALTGKLKDAGLSWKEAFAVSGPRRLTAVIESLDTRSADVREEKKGPKVGAPDQAIAGFLRGAGLTDISEAEIVSDPKKGDSYVAYLSKPGRDATKVIAEAVPEIIKGFHWPKSMRTASGDLRWVRPLQGIVCVFDGAVVPFEIGGITSGNQTEGHRVHGRGPYTVKGWADYRKQLEGKGHVILSRADRRARILEGIAEACGNAGLELVPDEGLLEEVTGLAEWPVVILGQMDPDFLDLPPEVIKLSMRTHQKYFAVRHPGAEGLAPNFIVVANIAASDGGAKIAEGNARVLSARLSDARFFWEKDKATPLEVMGEKLQTIAFKEELGSLGDKVERVAALARELASKVGADPDLAERAARLAKADLVSEMVGEFPELQGVMGRYYALARISAPLTPAKAGGQGGQEPHAVPASAGTSGGLLSGLPDPDIREIADAIRDHYKPQGPSDAVPSEPVAVAVALADKLDTLVGFWAIDEKPTGSKDPFALRRAALGVVRIVLDNDIRFGLTKVLKASFHRYYNPLALEFGYEGSLTMRMGVSRWDLLETSLKNAFVAKCIDICGISARKVVEYGEYARGERKDNPLSKANIQRTLEMVELALDATGRYCRENKLIDPRPVGFDASLSANSQRTVEREPELWVVRGVADFLGDLLSFFADRLKQVLRDQGKRHDLIDAVFALGEDDLVLIVKRVEALGAFLETEDGATLLAGYKRAANILKAEEKKGALPDGDVDSKLIAKGPAAEQALWKALTETRAALDAPLKEEDFAGAMRALAGLRAPVDAFFEAVMVNDPDESIRANRLALLMDVRSALHQVADFSRIEG